jgi:beta-lactam-binding protein with PASTA domain
MKSVKATERIYARGLCLHDIRFGAFNGRNNEVLEQSPRADALVPAGTSVTLTVTPAGQSGSMFVVARPAACEQPLNDPIGP